MIIEQTKNGILNVDKPQCITSQFFQIKKLDILEL